MNSERKAEIQRKLSMASVPKPPAGLSDRIKADIPKYLKATEVERERFSRSVAFNMRIAASIILLVTSVFVAMTLLTPNELPQSAEAPRSPVSTAVAKDARPSEPQTVSFPAASGSTSGMDELRVEMREEAAPRQRVAQMADAADAPALAPSSAPTAVAPGARTESYAYSTRERDAEDRLQRDSAGGVVGVSGGTAAAPVPPPQPVMVAEAAPPPPPVAANTTTTLATAAQTAKTATATPAVAAAAPALPEPTAALRADVQQQPQRKSASLMSEAIASDLSLGPRAKVFGIAVDPAVFHGIKSTLERGAKPAASAINVDALVNYFTGSPKSVKRDVQLDVEASPAPVATPENRRGLIRFTIDTERRDLPANSSVPPVATDARLEIEFDERAVASHRRIGQGSESAAEAVLLQNMSVTGLYEVELKPTLAPRQKVATVTLRYKSLANGKQQTRTKILYGSDFSRRWTAASRRHRLASLGALWAETLRGTSGATELAVKAEELATQSPGDAKARELANAATVSSKL